MPSQDDVVDQEVGYDYYNYGEGSRRASELYTQDLGMDRWRQVVLDPSYALSQDPLAWQKIQRDAIFQFCIQTRRRKVASREFNIEPASELEVDRQAAEIVKQALKQIPRFWMVRYNLTDADFRGSAYAIMTGGYKIWRPVMGDAAQGTLVKTAGRLWWMFNRIADVDRYRFRMANTTDKRRIVELKSIVRNSWEELRHPEWFLRHMYEDSEGAKGYGQGLLDALYFIHYTKMTCMEIGLQGVEAWANGRVEAAVDGLREAGTGKTNAAIATEWRKQVKYWMREHALVHDKLDEVNMHDGPTQGHNMALDFVNYCDSAACRLCVGSELPFGGNNGPGSLARAKEEADQSDEYVQPSRDLLAETFSDQAITLWWNMNRSNLAALGLQDADPPRLTLQATPAIDPEKEARVIAALHGAGLDLPLDEISKRTDYSVPGPGTRVLKGQSTPAFGGLDGPGGAPPFLDDQAADTGEGDDQPANDNAPKDKERPDQEAQRGGFVLDSLRKAAELQHREQTERMKGRRYARR